jgi:hypothetical protein
MLPKRHPPRRRPPQHIDLLAQHQIPRSVRSLRGDFRVCEKRRPYSITQVNLRCSTR